MPVYQIPKDKIIFPHPSLANKQGLLGIGGDLSKERIILAYSNGIFPWNNEGSEIRWWCLTPRLVLNPRKLKISKSLQQVIRRMNFTIQYDSAFNELIDGCSGIKRKNQEGTWIHRELKESFTQLFNAGIVHTVEVWRDNCLVGGLYGLSIGKMFCGESMFAKESNMSKVALYYLCQKLTDMEYKLIDCQQDTSHLRSLGAELMNQESFFNFLEDNKQYPIVKQKWR